MSNGDPTEPANETSTESRPASDSVPVSVPVSAPTPVLSPVEKQTMDAGKAWGYAKDLLTILVIPLLLWGVKLEVSNAERDLLIERQAEELEDLEEEIKEAQDIEDGVQANALKLAVLEGKLDTANGRLSEVVSLLRQ